MIIARREAGRERRENDSDNSLLAVFCRGDEDDTTFFQTLRNDPLMRGGVRRMVRRFPSKSRAAIDVEDVFQETCLRIWRKRIDLRNRFQNQADQAFRRYCLTVARRTIIDLLRQRFHPPRNGDGRTKDRRHEHSVEHDSLVRSTRTSKDEDPAIMVMTEDAIAHLPKTIREQIMEFLNDRRSFTPAKIKKLYERLKPFLHID